MLRYSSDARPSLVRQRRGSPSPQPSSAPPSSTVLRSRLSSATSSSPPSPNPAPSAAEPSPTARRPAPSAAVVPRRSTPAPARESPVPPPTTALGTLVCTPFRTHRTLPRDVSLTAALETGEALRAAGAQRRRASSALRAFGVDVTDAAASATAASVRLGRRHRRRRFVLRGAAEVSRAAADVAVDAVEVCLAELVAAHGEGVA